MREKISKYIDQIRGVSYKPKDLHDALDENSIILLRANNIDNGQINFDDVVYVDRKVVKEEQIIRNGDILICASSGSKNLVGKAAQFYSDVECTFGAFCKLVRPKNINEKYIGVFFQSPYYRINISKASQGANINNIRNEHIDCFEIEIVSEKNQEEISNIIEKITQIINNKNKELQLLDELVKSRFISQFDESDFPKKRIDEVCTLKSGTTFNKEFELTEGDMLYCKVSDMNLNGNEKYMTTSKTYVNNDIGLKACLPKNAVIFPKRGGAIGTNKKRITTSNTCVDLNTMGVIPNKEINIQYLYQFFQNIDLGSLCDGSAIPQLNNKNIGPLEIKVPSIELQNEFAEFVEKVDKSKFVIQQSLNETKKLFDSLMQQYFG